jgi:hypothetical protein
LYKIYFYDKIYVVSFSTESIGGGADGCIFGFSGEFPMGMKPSEVELALLELDTGIRGIHEPPIATVNSMCETEGPEEDRRRFTVEFEAEATKSHMIEAFEIVTQALQGYRHRA